MIDLSGIHTCPNCNARPRVTGVSPAKLPVKIRCSNKNCELSRHSVPTEFWQAINRSGAEELQKAYSQFTASLEAKDEQLFQKGSVLSWAKVYWVRLKKFSGKAILWENASTWARSQDYDTAVFGKAILDLDDLFGGVSETQ